MGTTTDVVPSAQNALHTLSGQVFSFGADFISFIVVTIAVMLFALYFGRDRLAPLIAGLYTALGLYAAFPYFSIPGDNPYAKIGLFLVLAGLSFVAFSGLSYFMAAHSGGFITELIMAGLIAGFLIAVSIHVLPVQDVYTFSDAAKSLFASNQAYFWWLVAPLAGLFFIGR
jgi:hypothetical protein